ncbi:MAG: DNA mismatch repair protein MutS [Fimbriiglobus sp.]
MTPMMQQFHDAKAQHPGMMIFFRNGDFYELFEDDAELGHRILGITLTKRDKEIPMAGFPYHKLEYYLNILLKAGHRVAVCEQMEVSDGKKKLIHREVNRVVTPGTVTEEELLDPRKPNHLAAIVPGKSGSFGLAWIDLPTGSFSCLDVKTANLPDECARLGIVECLQPENAVALLAPAFGNQAPRSLVTRPGWQFEPSAALDALHKHFAVSTMSGFGFDDGQPCLLAAGGLIIYLQETLKASLGHIRRLQPYRPERTLILDEVTRRSLEMTRTLRDNQREGSLISVLDRTVTPMGARFLFDALLSPLNDLPSIEARHDAVGELLDSHALRGQLRALLEGASDLQRLTTRVSTARANPKDLSAITRTLKLLPGVQSKLDLTKSKLLRELQDGIQPCPELRGLLDQALVEEPPFNPKDGGILREGYHAELDELRNLAREGKDWIARYQAEEVTRSGIASLKVGFTDVMGYYIEITNANETRVPTDYIHERTLKNAKRYSTPKLKEYEEKVVTAQERSQALEFELFLQLRDQVAAQTMKLLQTADALAQVDFLAGLADLAASRNYVRPQMVAEPILLVSEGRHPVLDQSLAAGTFVPNDVRFHPAEGVFWLITGPNMSGKSTFIRQVALLTLLAHLGSFVPAKKATVGLTDRIFTRVGASDELSRGQSTFMVEMTEAANILNNATSRSLVILDEIGRGTSTYDGVSLAWAMTEHLHDAIGCRTLFATHYHELARLDQTLPRLRNYTVQVEELADDVIFLHRISPGNAQKSFGIHVAKLAGVPGSILNRAKEVLSHLEQPTPYVARTPETAPLPEPPPTPKPKKVVKPVPDPIVVAPPEKPRKPIPARPNLFDSAD